MYIIKSIHNSEDQNGKKKVLVSYFESHQWGLVNFMTVDKKNAKTYQFKIEARRDIKKFFPSEKNVSIIKYKVSENNIERCNIDLIKIDPKISDAFEAKTFSQMSDEFKAEQFDDYPETFHPLIDDIID